MTERERLIQALGGERWLHLQAIADACEEEGRDDEAKAWRAVAEAKRAPYYSNKRYRWGNALGIARGAHAIRDIEKVGWTHKTEADAYEALVRVVTENIRNTQPYRPVV